MRKRKFSRKTLRRIGWIFRSELPFIGWYDIETDEIPIIIDNFAHEIWKAFSVESFVKFREILIREINYVIMHEYLHYVTQPANELEESDVFPSDDSKTPQENMIIIERKIIDASLSLCNLRRTIFLPSYHMQWRNGTINLGICKESYEELENEIFG